MKNGYIKNDFFYHSCGHKIFKFAPNSVIINHIAYCSNCKEELSVTIFEGNLIKVEPHNIQKSS